jgi:hypothetical protein
MLQNTDCLSVHLNVNVVLDEIDWDAINFDVPREAYVKIQLNGISFSFTNMMDDCREI